MNANRYQPANSPDAATKTRPTRWMLWSGVILLLLAAICVITTFAAIFGSYMEALDAMEPLGASSTTTQPNNSPKAIIIEFIALLFAAALTLVGFVLLILGFFRRQPMK